MIKAHEHNLDQNIKLSLSKGERPCNIECNLSYSSKTHQLIQNPMSNLISALKNRILPKDYKISTNQRQKSRKRVTLGD